MKVFSCNSALSLRFRMLYYRNLLARKAPLWMSATMDAKIHRKKLDELNIYEGCRLLSFFCSFFGQVDIKEAWKLKSAPSDPTRLP
ncbi:hypothetical protein OROGR_018564 [Orobanche gracilis]